MADAAPKGFEAEFKAWGSSQDLVLSLLDEIKEAAKAGAVEPPSLADIGLDPAVMPELDPAMAAAVTPKELREAYLFSMALARKFTLNFWSGKGHPFSDECERLAERYEWLRGSLAKRAPVLAWADTLQVFVSVCLEFFDGINGVPEFERKDDLLYAWGISYSYMCLYDIASRVKDRYFGRELERAGGDAVMRATTLLAAGDVFLEDGDPLKAADYLLQAYRSGGERARKEVMQRVERFAELDPEIAETFGGLLRK